jgi:hypothetical protein
MGKRVNAPEVLEARLAGEFRFQTQRGQGEWIIVA